MKHSSQFLTLLSLGFAASMTGCQNQVKDPGKPNVVIIFLDDSGWSDFNPFTKNDYPTPNVDRLAEEGTSFHQFYVPQAICSASRAALLSGCYPGRTGVVGAHGPHAHGLDPGFATLGEVLQKDGYATAVFGKWHIGDQPETRPWNRGFDESCGLMYSNDMWKYNPLDPVKWGKFPLQFWEGDSVSIPDVDSADQKMLTTWYTEHAVSFINRHKDHPFFLYVPHNMPHVPIFCSDKFAGKSGKGRYADVIMELDWSVGEIMKALKKNGVENNTLVIFTSDNGPWITFGNHAGKTPYREAKATSFDGGTRSACIMKYPGHIPAGKISDQAFCTIDFMPTICHLTGARLPENKIDGMDVTDLIMSTPGAENPHQYYAFSTGKNLEAVMSGDGRWKLHLPHEYRTLVRAGKDGMPGEYEQKTIGLSLFDMKNDPFEKDDLSARYPDITSRLQGYAREQQEKFYQTDGAGVTK